MKYLLVEYASFWRRLVAGLFDSIWLNGLVILLFYLLQHYLDYTLIELSTTAFEHPQTWETMLITHLLPALIVIGFWHAYAATPGKLLLDCEIVDAYSGQPLRLKQAIVRYLGYFVSALPLGLGFLWILWDKRRQGWHDKIARTVVIIHDEAHIPLAQLEKDWL